MQSLKYSISISSWYFTEVSMVFNNYLFSQNKGDISISASLEISSVIGTINHCILGYRLQADIVFTDTGLWYSSHYQKEPETFCLCTDFVSIPHSLHQAFLRIHFFHLFFSPCALSICIVGDFLFPFKEKLGFLFLSHYTMNCQVTNLDRTMNFEPRRLMYVRAICYSSLR